MSTSAEGASDGGSAPPPHTGEPRYTPDDRVAPEDASLLWPDAHLLAEPPAGYRPLEMPAAWEPASPPAPPHPPAGGPPPQAPPGAEPRPATAPRPETAPQPWRYAPYAPSSRRPPEPEPAPPPAAGPVPGYVISMPYEGTTERAAPALSSPARPATPRSFRDLRHGPLADREFASMQEFAVAAVLEAGYAEEVVARLFRFTPWQLRAWVDEARGTSFGPGRGPA